MTEDAVEPEQPPKRRLFSRRRMIVLGLGLAILAGACATTAVVVTRDDEPAEAAEDNPVLEAPDTTARRAKATGTPSTLPPLPVPEPPPADPYADVPVIQIGAMSIPKINLFHGIYEGVTLTVINHGPGHWPGSALPGQRGNAVFPGHRTTYSKPFNGLDLLAPGDEVVFHMPEGDQVYAVRETLIVKPTDLWIIDQSQAKTFTLIACHPKGSARERIVVKGDFVKTIPVPSPPP
ncbi:MAG: sortase [Actinomycetota bacterium]